MARGKKQKEEEVKPEVVLEQPKVELEVKEEEVKSPKQYDRSANRRVLLDILEAKEIELNGRKCWELKLSDGTTDVVPGEDPDRLLVW